VLTGIADVLGSSVPCIGGTAADDGTLDGGGWVAALSHDSPGDTSSSSLAASQSEGPPTPFIAKSTESDSGEGVVLTLMWPSVETRMVFSSCYSHNRAEDPSTGEDRLVGTITKAEGRVIHEIDGKPAADVYGAWAGDTVDMKGYQDVLKAFHASKPTDPVNILGVTALRPLGRVAHGHAGEAAEAASLIHPSHITPDGGLALFAAVQEGERIMMMEATKDDLIELMSAATKQEYAGDEIASFKTQLQGALAIYCGGCSLTVGQDKLSSVGTNISSALSRKPFLTCFTYGEVGTVVGDPETPLPGGTAASSEGLGLDGPNGIPQSQNCHGNLMYSMLLFGANKGGGRDPHSERRLSYGGWTADSSHETRLASTNSSSSGCEMPHSPRLENSSDSYSSGVHSADI